MKKIVFFILGTVLICNLSAQNYNSSNSSDFSLGNGLIINSGNDYQFKLSGMIQPTFSVAVDSLDNTELEECFPVKKGYYTYTQGRGTTINNLDVYPNPTNDIFNVSFVSEEIQTLQLRVLNIVGEVVYTENLEQFVGEYTKQISIGNNAKGVYFLEITDNQGTINKKIIIKQ